MPITPDITPNPNALKFTVGQSVGEPANFAAGSEPDNELAAAILGITGVVNVFMTADFVTVNKAPDSNWDEIVPETVKILEEHFPT